MRAGDNNPYATLMLVTEMVMAPVIGLILGGYLDRKLASAPYLLLLGGLAGLAAAIRVGRIIFKMMKRNS